MEPTFITSSTVTTRASRRKILLVLGQILFWGISLLYLLFKQPIKIGLLSYETGSMQWFLVLSTIVNIIFTYSLFFAIKNSPLGEGASRIVWFILKVVTMFIAAGCVKWGLYEGLSYWWLFSSGEYPGIDWREFRFAFIFSIPYLTLGCVLGFYAKWNQEFSASMSLKARTSAAELKALQMQINPHFVFNSLNALYSLANKEKADRTGEGIMLLAEIMRHLLSVENKPLVSLASELSYLDSYIKLQKLRIPDSAQVQITFKVTGEVEHWQVPPLLFVTFIENAFQYGVSYQKPSYILIDFKLSDSLLHFRCSNSIVKSSSIEAEELQIEHSGENGGMGQLNAQQRLTTLFGDKATMNLVSTDKEYQASIEIKR